ncbi:MAG: DUF1015 domain-containing protein [Deltaproteobacteria bacterium]|nr:DUF1015 domain-containing protein [Deltaproteobacteria bacterium]
MAILAPFKGLTYNFQRFHDLSNLVAPPYDVISEKEQDLYYRTHPYNVIRLILAKKKTGDSDWDNRYTRAADTLKRWESEDALIRSDHPAMYLTSLEYDPGDGTKRVRWGLIAVVRIEDEGSRVILPHEQTFSAHKDDRLRLMRACNTQLSQIFGLYDDPDDLILDSLRKAVYDPPLASFEFKDKTKYEMWEVLDQAIFKKVARFMKDKAIFIADGHHRYETARNFRNLMRARYGKIPENRSHEFILMYLANMNDPGLTILPSHRLIRKCDGFKLSGFLDKLKKAFDIQEFPYTPSGRSQQIADFKKKLEDKGRATTAMGFYHRQSELFFLLSLRPGARDTMGDGLASSLKNLDVMVLSRLVLLKGLGFTKEDLDNEALFHYSSNMTEAVSEVTSGAYEMTFLLNPTKMDHVKEVAGHGLIMPRKSTYFYPKVLTGLVFNKIDPNEIIHTS